MKALLPELLAASKSADVDTLEKYLEPDVIPGMREAQRLMNDLDPKLKAVEQLIRDKLKVDPPTKLAAMASESWPARP